MSCQVKGNPTKFQSSYTHLFRQSETKFAVQQARTFSPSTAKDQSVYDELLSKYEGEI